MSHALCISNFGFYKRAKHVSQALSAAGLVFAGVSKEPTKAAAFVYFDSAVDLAAAQIKIPQLLGKDQKPFTVRDVTATAQQKHFTRAMSSDVGVVTQRSDADIASDIAAAAAIDVRDVLTPWREVPYKEQLERKTEEMGDVLRALALKVRRLSLRRRDVRGLDRGIAPSVAVLLGTDTGKVKRRRPDDAASENSRAATTGQPPPRHLVDLAQGIPDDMIADLPQWVLTGPRNNDGLACRMLPIIPSPLLEGYRNKCSFTIGVDASGAPCVGARPTGYRQAACIVTSTEGCLHEPAAVRDIVRLVQQFVASSPLAPYDLTSHGGCWRALTVRWAASTGQLMVVLLAAPPAESTTPTTPATLDGVAVVANIPSTGSAKGLHCADVPALPQLQDADLRHAGSCAVDHGTSASVDINKDVRGDASTAAIASPVNRGTKDTYNSELARLVDSLCGHSEVAGATRPTFSVTSLFVQEYDGISQVPPPNWPNRLLAGAPQIVERMCGMQFAISPNAFFQVNTPAAERLYELVRALAIGGPPIVDGAVAGKACAVDTSAPPAEVDVATGAASAPSTSSDCLTVASAPAPSIDAFSMLPTLRPAPDVTLVDICCGTGTIGLVCAPLVGKVVGIELVAEAVADAERNALANGVSNASFIVGDMRTMVRDVGKRLEQVAVADLANRTAESTIVVQARSSSQRRGLVGIVDPPRGGLTLDVVKALRTWRGMDRIVYVSCNPTGSLLEDAARLCMPDDADGTYARGPPFVPVCAVPVDLFPHTPHCEMVVLFERVKR